MFLKEETFCEYLRETFFEKEFEKGHSVISINMVHMQPIMSCIYVSDDCVAAAKYNRQLQIFTNGLYFSKNQIQKITFYQKGLGGFLSIKTTENLPDGQPITLQLVLSPLTGTKWHKENFKKIRNLYQEHS